MRWFRKPEPVSAPLTLATVTRDAPAIAAALREEGAQWERERILGVYKAASWVVLEPLVERLMFDGKTPPEAACLAKVAALQAQTVIVSECQRHGLTQVSMN